MPSDAVTDAAALITAISQFAWPAAVVVLVLVFRKAIAEQARRLTALKAAGAEMTFTQRVDEVVRESGELVTSVADEVSAARDAFLLQMASKDPRMAIRQGWEVVREVAQSLARRRHVTWTNTKNFVELLEEEGALPGSVMRLVLNLRSLRYDMADNDQQEVSPTAAAAYVTAVSSVAKLLGSLPSSNK